MRRKKQVSKVVITPKWRVCCTNHCVDDPYYSEIVDSIEVALAWKKLHDLEHHGITD